MKSKASVILLLAVSLFILVSWTVYAQKNGSSRQAWEYTSLLNGSHADLNKLGAEGWEMVGFSVDDSQNKFFYFKRAK
jgi:hypothetical protein